MSDGLQKFHSAVRWGKPVAEIEALVGADPSVVNGEDEKNGNSAIHIAAQNGHIELTKYLQSKGANLNAQNKKGQTALHMSVEYDFTAQTEFLLASGADKDLKNGDGHPAILGIDGGKTGADAWDAPIKRLKAVTDEKSMKEAFMLLEQAKAEDIDKAVLAQAGMKLKKEFAAFWDHKAFMAIVQKF
mmetsp:Transcript_20451/g.51675  ORF Transcript_20451/g.51675 Transcript_20451/m.51675 type:complete len:187 (+) Transcript_20451:162-722(+)|eukprot:CAMPEP_0178992090 /NCGR_PEP_ID=MMETSP0795-20121207/5907_1 /TAXON_ID=88552 /ORGANISM="Amoebophrya sp., Strain Ameob2" /LENGTH=186 /DNA_ID=CAMNT_0020683905 /DNA_START=217 /DNA_END=777 /DNA_ORIENTATION=-